MLAVCWPYFGLCLPYLRLSWPVLALSWPYVGLCCPHVDHLGAYVGSMLAICLAISVETTSICQFSPPRPLLEPKAMQIPRSLNIAKIEAVAAERPETPQNPMFFHHYAHKTW